MASRRGRVAFCALAIVLSAFPQRLDPHEAIASATSPLEPVPPPDPSAISAEIEQGPMVHVFDTRTIAGGPYYVNDHSLIQAPDGSWHLFGIFHREPIGDDTEVDFIHARSFERDPARWKAGSFTAVPAPHMVALQADRRIGETHVWAPHVVAEGDRYVMIYQGGGPDGDHSSIRLAESDDLYRWTKIGETPVFEDFCVARDPMLVRREGTWALYYTRCAEAATHTSGVAYRLSRDLIHWSDARMVLILSDKPPMANSGFTESPFVFERGGHHYLSISAYPTAWDATMVYRSPAPFAFPSVPFTRLRAHAAEWVPSADGTRMLVTHAGPGQSGVWVSEVSGL